MKNIIFISILFLSIFIFKKKLFSNEFIYKNPYSKVETFYENSNNKKEALMNISIIKLTPVAIQGIEKGDHIILKPPEGDSLTFVATTTLYGFPASKETKNILKNFEKNNFLPINSVHGTIEIEKNKVKKDFYLLGINEHSKKIEKIYSYKVAELPTLEFNITLDRRFKNTFLNLSGMGTNFPEKLNNTSDLFDYSKMMTCECPQGSKDPVTVQSVTDSVNTTTLNNYNFYTLNNNHQIACSTVESSEENYIKNSIFFKADGTIENCDIVLNNGRKIHFNIKYINLSYYTGSASIDFNNTIRHTLFTFLIKDTEFNDESYDSNIKNNSHITLEHLKGYLPQAKNLKIDRIKVTDNDNIFDINNSNYSIPHIFSMNCSEGKFRISTSSEKIEIKKHVIYEYFYHDVSLGTFTLDINQDGPPPKVDEGQGIIDMSLGQPNISYIFDKVTEHLKNATVHSTGVIDITNFTGIYPKIFSKTTGVKNLIDTIIATINNNPSETIKDTFYKNDYISLGFNKEGNLEISKLDSKKLYKDKIFLIFKYNNLILGNLTMNISNDLPMDYTGEGILNLKNATPTIIYTFPKDEKEYSGETIPSSGTLSLEKIKGFLPHTYGLGKNNIIDSMKVSINGGNEKTISGTLYENENYSINLNSNGQMEIKKKTKHIFRDNLILKYFYKNVLIGTFSFDITNFYIGNCNFEIIPNKLVDGNYTFDSKGNQLSGDKNYQLTGDNIPQGKSIDKFKIESDLGIEEKTIEEGQDNLLEFQKDGNIFKIGFDKNRNFNISLIKASSKNLDFNFKLIGSYKNEIFETFNFNIKRKPLDHTKEHLNMVLNNPSEYLLSNKDQGILLGKNLQPYGKDPNCEKNITGTGTSIDTDFSSKAHLRKLKFKNKEYELKYDPQEDAYITEPFEINPNFKSSFYLSSKNGTFGFKKNLQWNGEEVKENFTYLEYNSLGETCTEHTIDLNVKKFIPNTSVIEVSIPSGLTLPFEVTIDSKGNPSNKRISINHQGQVPYLNSEDSKIDCTIGDKKSTLDIHNPLFSFNGENKSYAVGYKNSQLYLKINSVDLKTPLDETIILSQEINNTLNGAPIHRSDYKIILKRKPIFISIEGDTMEFGDMISKGGIYYGKSKVILTNTENRIIKTKVINPNCFLVNENNSEDKLPIKNINVTDVLNTSLNTSIFYIQGTVNVTDQSPGNYKGNIILELTLDS